MGFSLGGTLGKIANVATLGQGENLLNVFSGGLIGDGPLGDSGSGAATTTTVQRPFAEQLPFIKDVFSSAKTQFDQGPLQAFQGQQVAGFDPATLLAQEQQLAAAGQLTPQIQEALNALKSRFAGADPANDPTVNAFADAATRPLMQQSQEQILPGIQSNAIQQGAFGGSRQAITEGQAVEGATRAIGDVRAGIFQDAFKTQQQQQLQALQLAPSLFSQASLPATLSSEVGSQREQLQQAEIDAAMRKFNFEQAAPGQNLNQFSNLINQFSGVGGSTESTATAARPGGLQSALSGAALGSTFGPIGAVAGGAAGLTGLLG